MKDDDSEVKTLSLQTKDRAQKIVAALYLLTDHLDVENPIRTEIRSNATLMLKAVLSGSKIDDLKNSIASFISVAVLTKEISAQNASILEEQLDNLKMSHSQLSEPVLSHLFVHDKEHVLIEGKDSKDIKTKSFLMSGAGQGQISINDKVVLPEKKDSIRAPQDGHSETKYQESKNTDIKENVPNKKDEKKARRNRVLEYLSKTELKTIKDISKFFTDCSEKTIQRELNDLVEERLIVRVGDRRWSTYRLA